MRAVDAATTMGSSAFAIAGKVAPAAVDPARAIRNVLFCHGLAALVAVCLLPASNHEVWAQLCVCAEPGWMNCALMGFSSHEPATAAFPQCMARSRGAGLGGGGAGGAGGSGGQRAFHRPKSRAPAAHVEHAPAYPRQAPQSPVAIPSQPAAVAPAPSPSESNPPASPPDAAEAGYEPYKTPEIQPLPCPKGLVKVDETFYGGTRCGAAAGAKPATAPAEPPKADAGAGDAIGAAVNQAIPEAPSEDMKDAKRKIQDLINAQLQARGLPPLPPPPPVGVGK